ncbi:MAG: polysaccharide pyruvyl transferase family protein [Verrucomicrobiota bacterium]
MSTPASHSDRPVLALFGAMDRFNYGDLLFPFVIKSLLKNEAPEKYRLECVGLRRSHLKEAGSFPTHPVRWLNRMDSLREGSAVIVVGGEVLGAGWDRLSSYLLPPRTGDFLHAALEKMIGSERIAQASRRYFGAPWEIPFVPDPRFLPRRVPVLYNQVGGIGLLNRPVNWLENIDRLIDKADYCSVRDSVTHQIIECADLEVELAPDSAVLVSDIFPRSALEKRMGDATHRLINEIRDGYLCFQCNRYIGQHRLEQIARQLRTISRDTGWHIVLLPLGLVPGHSDRVALQRLRKLLGPLAVLPEKTSVYDLTALLANARFFVGTSLHGTIAAISYEVPYAGINKVAKLAASLETWCSPPFREVVDMEDIADAVRERSEGHAEILAKDSRRLKKKARAAFENLYRALPGNS